MARVAFGLEPEVAIAELVHFLPRYPDVVTPEKVRPPSRSAAADSRFGPMLLRLLLPLLVFVTCIEDACFA